MQERLLHARRAVGLELPSVSAVVVAHCVCGVRVVIATHTYCDIEVLQVDSTESATGIGLTFTRRGKVRKQGAHPGH